MRNKKAICLFSAVIISLGFIFAGHSIGKGFYLAKKMGRVVTVKGLAEKDVKSDLGLWEINYREIGSDLVQLDQRLQHDHEVVQAFLKQQGFTDEEIERSQFKVEDR